MNQPRAYSQDPKPVIELRPGQRHARAAGNDSWLFKPPEYAWLTIALVALVCAMWLVGMLGGVSGALPLWVCMPLCTLSAHAAFTGMHDASHLALARDPRISIAAGELCASVLLARFQAFRQIHLRHHQYTNDPRRDPDRWTGIGPRWQLPLRWATTDINYYREYDPGSLTIPAWQTSASWATAILLVAAIVALVALGKWRAFLLLWLVPARIALFVAAYVADYVPHMRPFGVPRSTHRYRHTAVIRGRGLSFLLFGHNVHLVHHLYPSVPFYRCIRIWRVRRAKLCQQGAREVSLFRRPGSGGGATGPQSSSDL